MSKVIYHKGNSDRWYTRGYLPHFEANVTQFVTIRTFDSLPKYVKSKKIISQCLDKLNKSENRKFIDDESLLDKGLGSCYLKIPAVAESVKKTLYFYNMSRYELHAWVIMPNHVHLLITPMNDFKLSFIIQRIKSYSAASVNKILNRKGPLWYQDYFDRYIRNEEHFIKTLNYIENNPVKAVLCTNAEDWEFGSAACRDK